MKTVQLAIQDAEYAQSVRNLLLQDGRHSVHVVERPDVRLGGIIVVEATNLESHPLLASEQNRLVVIVRKERDDLSKIWHAGVRHVVFHSDPPQKARVVVLSAELTLWSIEER